ncbi:terminase small subunit [Xanthobacter sp. TB0136]|uniref:terminase small subunit n=1 Tax=Xanthobacter sp. TB0136 TaxID=3459177 RepID=UPI0040393F00
MSGQLVNQAQLAALFGVQPITIRAWVRKGCPEEVKGGGGKRAAYNTAAVIRWREEQAALAATGDASALDEAELKKRKLAAEMGLAELELSVRRGEYVEIEQVGALVADEYATVRANFTAMPGDIAPDLEGCTAAEIQELMMAKVTEILHGLSADDLYAPEAEASEGAGGSTEAATEAESD